MRRDKQKQLGIKISHTMHKKLKEVAQKRNITITTFVIRTLVKALYEEFKYQ